MNGTISFPIEFSPSIKNQCNIPQATLAPSACRPAGHQHPSLNGTVVYIVEPKKKKKVPPSPFPPIPSPPCCTPHRNEGSMLWMAIGSSPALVPWTSLMHCYPDEVSIAGFRPSKPLISNAQLVAQLTVLTCWGKPVNARAAGRFVPSLFRRIQIARRVAARSTTALLCHDPTLGQPVSLLAQLDLGNSIIIVQCNSLVPTHWCLAARVLSN